MNGDLQIKPVCDRASMRRFIDVPARLYRGDPHWVPALRSAEWKMFGRKTAFFAQAVMGLFVAERSGVPVGRIAAIQNRAHNKHYQDHVGFFGFFECAADSAAAQALVAEAARWLTARGLTSMRGPVNPSMNGECGLLIDGFGRPPMALMPYNPPFYRGLLEEAGFAKCKDLFAYLVNADKLDPGTAAGDRLRRLGELLRRRNPEVTLRTIDMGRYEEDVLRLMDVFETARKKNWGYVPLTKEQILETARELRRIIDPELVIVAEVEGKPAGALLAIPNINVPLKAVRGRLFPLGFIRFFRELRRVREARILGVAALQEDRAKGITASLFIEVILRGLNRGYRLAEASWVLEDNQMSNASIQGALEPTLYKTYRIFEKAITG
jgi:hypothetical protein